MLNPVLALCRAPFAAAHYIHIMDSISTDLVTVLNPINGKGYAHLMAW